MHALVCTDHTLMVSPLVKIAGAVVAALPVALTLGLVDRTVKRREDALVPVVEKQQSPLRVTVYAKYLDRRTHELLDPKSMKRGYVDYDIRVDNRGDRTVRGIDVRIEGADEERFGHVSVGDIAPHGFAMVKVKKSWNKQLELHRVGALGSLGSPVALVTWKAGVGRQRTRASVDATRLLPENGREAARRRRARPPVTAQVMS
jgi:hypothetical protein